MAGPHLGRAPLQSAACELRFPARPRYAESTVERLAEALAERYDAYATDQGINLQIGPGGISEQPMIRHRFDDGGGWVVAVTNEALVLESTVYQNIDEFLERWRWVQEVVAPVLPIRRVTRLGLRYVNQLNLRIGSTSGAHNWALDPKLLAPWDLVGGEPMASLAELRTQRENAFLTLRHGLVADKIYLLDFDHYTEGPQAAAVDKVVERLRLFNDVIAVAFRSSVTQEQWDAFDPKDEQ